MKLDEARELLGLDLKATRREIRAAYRRAARRWHPDRAPEGQEEAFRARMQEVNAAYQKLSQFMEEYRFELVEKPDPEDIQEWWNKRFATGVWGPPPPRDSGEDQD